MHFRAFPHCRQRRVWYWPWNDIYDDAPNTCKQCLTRVTKMPKESFLPLHLGKREQHSQTVQVTFGRLDKLNAKKQQWACYRRFLENVWKCQGFPDTESTKDLLSPLRQLICRWAETVWRVHHQARNSLVVPNTHLQHSTMLTTTQISMLCFIPTLFLLLVEV